MDSGIGKLELAAGEDQLIVGFVNRDNASQVDVTALLTELSRDAAERERQGWRLISVGSLPMRQMGTAGNIFFQSGGQFVTQLTVVGVYARETSKT